MKVSGKFICCICDGPITGLITIVPGIIPVSINAQGNVIRRGGVEVFWNKQRNVSDTIHKLWVCCANGHEWVLNVVEYDI